MADSNANYAFLTQYASWNNTTRGDQLDYLDLLQWPAMAVTLIASWLVASRGISKRNWGFWVFLISNLLWIIWGVKSQSWALVVLQVGLIIMNIRGAMKTEPEATAS